ncbi:hypothetical protein [Synechococcus sp. UW140]|uniref:hypothetical protein n=1 Tax=Synechococcus sp. UW140 TaxID=368503 RepID=UPI001FCB8C9D|nr:hypothetical protein [Synechococcus sp. UW140]
MRLAAVSSAVALSLPLAALVPAAPVLAGSVERLIPLVQVCFSTQRPRACEQALVQSEDLQQQAADQDRYPCQSMVLGLQADVVMVQLQAGRGKLAYETLDAVGQRCRGL